MKINSFSSVYVAKNNYFLKNSKKNSNYLNKISKDTFIKNTPPLIPFKGAPYKLSSYFDISGTISANKAIEIYEKLKLGNYLDHGGDLTNEYYKTIRQENLKFLEHIYSTEEKRKFVNYFSDLTGFPNLEKVAKKIEDEFVRASEKASEQARLHSYDFIDKKPFNIIALGYDGVCSIADNSALPGSDLDKAYIILEGSKDADLAKDARIVEKFKGYLWEETDQRILSYNHDLFSFPKVYTKWQIRAMIRELNLLCRKSKIGISDGLSRDNNRILKLHNISTEFHSGKKGFVSINPLVPLEIFNKNYIKMGLEDATYLSWRKIPEKYIEDYAKANKFLINLLETVPKRGGWGSELYKDKKFYKEDMYDFAFTLEAMLWGKQFMVKNGTDKYYDVMNYFTPDIRLSDCLNTSQIRALKKGTHVKQKRKLRKELAQDFKNFDIDKQFEIVKQIIKGSCNMNDNPKYNNLFTSNEPKRTVLLYNALGLGENE